MVGDCGQWPQNSNCIQKLLPRSLGKWRTRVFCWQCYPRSPQKMAVATIGGSTRFVPSWERKHHSFPSLVMQQAVVKGWTKAPKLLERLEAGWVCLNWNGGMCIGLLYVDIMLLSYIIYVWWEQSVNVQCWCNTVYLRLLYIAVQLLILPGLAYFCT